MRKRVNESFFSQDDQHSHSKALDGLRGIAVILVLLSHSSNANIFFGECLNFQKAGKYGVYLFFVLSAYLLDRQISIALLSGKANKLYWKNYLLRRFLRIYPIFGVALFIYLLFSFIGIGTCIDKLQSVFLHLLLIKGEGVFWSIAVEFKYYLISPLLMIFCYRFLKWNPVKMLILFIIIILSAIIIEYKFNFSSTSTFRFLPIFLVGTSIAIYEEYIKQKIETYNRVTHLSRRVILNYTFSICYIKSAF